MKTALYVMLILLSFSLAALAGTQDSAKQAQQGAAPNGALSFDDLRLACQNPARFHNQIAPSNIQISCRDISYKWIPDTEGSLNFLTARQVTAQIYSDKYTVNSYSAPINSPNQTMTCPRFKQVMEKVETVRSVTCDDILSFNGSAVDFCRDSLDSSKYGNPDAVNETPTGQTVDLCNMRSSQQQQAQQQQQQPSKGTK